MAFLFHSNTFSSNGRRLTGFPRYTEVLERNMKKFLFTNLLTLIGFLPFGIGVAIAILSSSILVLIPSCIIGGVFAGPALSCMYDSVMRGLRDAPGKCWENYKHAWKQPRMALDTVNLSRNSVLFHARNLHFYGNAVLVVCTIPGMGNTCAICI